MPILQQTEGGMLLFLDDKNQYKKEKGLLMEVNKMP